ncbi:hypothetical protein LGK97_01920 [Clostridium sp. CS001]|uniref:hypothetical protein n=1 Tax=Clostridium sp. CS001 TaxID=2880648 RepID=UPI001CF3BC52|nr:hypothetical protein [Clostridium sp. CS001]MCB2288522.1 hypothetical protein [Clostridium sp. CS001]
MSNIKANSFRVQEYDVKNFKGFAEVNNLNHAEMVTTLVNAFGLSTIKDEIVNIAKEDKSELQYELIEYENSFI